MPMTRPVSHPLIGTRVCVTGAAGNIGTALLRGLPALGHLVRGVDLHQPNETPGSRVEMIIGDLWDDSVCDKAMHGTDAVVHLAAIPHEAPFREIMESHLFLTERVLEGMRRNHVNRLVYASSNHAVGFTRRQPLLTTDVRPRPDTFYGVAKVAAEALASLYHDRCGIKIACLRIGSFSDRPRVPRHLATWLSPGDCVRLVHACLTSPALGFDIVYGISRNTRGWWDLSAARRLGYEPHDDAEDWAAEVLGADPGERYVGGEYVGPHPNVWP
jgi:uronate dehydrogenase